jgi:hypothetical protein
MPELHAAILSQKIKQTFMIVFEDRIKGVCVVRPRALFDRPSDAFARRYGCALAPVSRLVEQIDHAPVEKEANEISTVTIYSLHDREDIAP